MKLTRAEKRILEIWFHYFYLWYVTNNSRHNHEHFLMLPELLQTNYDYDPDIISIVWRDYLIDNPQPPADTEVLLAMSRISKILNCSSRMLDPFFKFRAKNRRIKIQTFRKINVQLMPKIKHETFHNNLVDFLLQIDYTFNRINRLFKAEVRNVRKNVRNI